MVVQVLKITSSTSHDVRYNFEPYCCEILKFEDDNFELAIFEDIQKIVIDDFKGTCECSDDGSYDEIYEKVKNIKEGTLELYFEKLSKVLDDKEKASIDRIGTSEHNYKKMYDEDKFVIGNKSGLLYYCDIMVGFDAGHHYTYIVNVI